MKQLFVNNFATALVGDIAAGDSILVAANATGLPTPGAGQHFLLTLIGLDANGNEVLWEVVKVTNRSGTTLTAARGQDGTAARAWPDGTLVEARLTGGSMDGKEDAIANGTAEQFWRGDKSWRSILSAVQGALLTGLNLTTGTAITATDSMLSAMGKLQKQISDITSDFAADVRGVALAGYITGANTAIAASDTVQGALQKLQGQINARAPLLSPPLTGTPTAPTAAAGTNSTQVASTAFTVAEIASRAPTKTGGGASGTWPINISGNATGLTDTGWITPTLLNGWVHVADRPIGYRKVGNRVMFRGAAYNTDYAKNNSAGFIVPVGYRSPSTVVLAGTGSSYTVFFALLYIPTDTYAANFNDRSTPSGMVTVCIDSCSYEI